MNTTPTSYLPLDPDKEEIRLLVLPPKSSTFADYEFVHVSLLSDVPYEALSYAWGSNSPSNTITISGHPFSIRSNLRAALSEISLRGRKRLIWVDALCINQLDIAERNAQVSLMSSIYARASHVLIWLGTAERDYWGAMVLIDVIGHPSPSSTETFIDYAGVQHVKFWTELSLLCHRPYWQRLWIIQEVVLAYRLKAHCSSLTFEWERLESLFRRLQVVLRTAENLYASSPSSGTSAARYTHLLHTIRGIQASVPARLCLRRQEIKKQIPLVDLFLLHQEALCSEPRDRFFGLYSLAMQCCKKASPADYEKTLAEVHSTILVHHFRSHVDKHEVLQKFREFRDTMMHAFPPSLGFCHDLQDDQGVLKVVGNIEGKILWLSPTLDTISFPEYFCEFSDEEIDLTPALVEKLAHQSYLFRKGLLNSTPISSTSRVCDLSTSRAPSISAFYPSNFPAAEKQGESESPLRRVLSPSRRHRTINALHSTLFAILELAFLSLPSRHCRIFLADNGGMGICFPNTKAEDLIVRFSGHEAMLILRNETTNNAAVCGRAVPLFEEKAATSKREMHNPIVLRMDLVALKMLSMNEIMGDTQ